MAKRTTTKKRKAQADERHPLGPPDLKGWIASLYQRGILSLLLVSLSVVTFLGLIPDELHPQDTGGVVIDWWSDLRLPALA